MTMYLYQATYTPEAIAAQIRNPQDRIEILRPAVEKAGARVVAYGYPAGQASLVLILDVPDDVVGEVSLLSVYSQGTFRESTAVRLLTGEQWVEALTATQAPAAEYIPPGEIRLPARRWTRASKRCPRTPPKWKPPSVRYRNSKSRWLARPGLMKSR
jgi:uncharacterized protein with GYD domain